MSKVLIGIVTHNRAELLVRAIESALAQDYPDKEVAVYDDGSSDGTSLVADKKYPQVSWHTADISVGCIQARNKMMRATSAEFFVSLDDDAWFMMADEISIGVAFMKAQPQVAALAFDILSPSDPFPARRIPPRSSHLFVGCGHMLRLSTLNEVGHYSPSPGRYGAEESDLCIRLLDQEYEVVSLPGVHVWHEETPIARNVESNYSSRVCNDLAFAYRRCPYPALLCVLPGKLFHHFEFAVKHRLVWPFCQGVITFIRALPVIANGRRPVARATFHEFRRRAHDAAQIA